MTRAEYEVTRKTPDGGARLERVKAWTVKLVDGCLVFDDWNVVYARGEWFKVKRDG